MSEPTPQQTGHVFVVPGNLHHIDADAVVLPSDTAFKVESAWREALTDWPRTAAPADWAARGWGRSSGDHERPAWFIDVTDHNRVTTPSVIGARVADLLDDVSASPDVTAGPGRCQRLVAIPVLGVGRAGLGDGATRGQMIDTLLRVCEGAARRHGVDIALVAFNRADYSAFQDSRAGGELDGVREAHAVALGERIKRGNVALFLGAGVSIGAGLPSWAGLLDGLADDAPIDHATLQELDSFLDRAELLSAVLGDKLHASVAKRVDAKRYGLVHSLVASFGVVEVVTTNYDRLYEMAAADVLKEKLAILPSASAEDHAPHAWLLKMHGDVDRDRSIVLSRSDFVRYDASWRPLGAIVQSLLMTRHLVVIGTSLTDDNVLRLAHEVIELLRRTGGGAPALLGTVLSLGPSDAEQRLWSGTLDFVPVSRVRVDPTLDDETKDRHRQAQARDLAIFLDRVAVHSAPTAHVADARYADLLASDQERTVAKSAKALAEAIERLPPEVRARWAGLQAAFAEHGA